MLLEETGGLIGAATFDASGAVHGVGAVGRGSVGPADVGVATAQAGRDADALAGVD